MKYLAIFLWITITLHETRAGVLGVGLQPPENNTAPANATNTSLPPTNTSAVKVVNIEKKTNTSVATNVTTMTTHDHPTEEKTLSSLDVNEKEKKIQEEKCNKSEENCDKKKDTGTKSTQTEKKASENKTKQKDSGNGKPAKDKGLDKSSKTDTPDATKDGNGGVEELHPSSPTSISPPVSNNESTTEHGLPEPVFPVNKSQIAQKMDHSTTKEPSEVKDMTNHDGNYKGELDVDDDKHIANKSKEKKPVPEDKPKKTEENTKKSNATSEASNDKKKDSSNNSKELEHSDKVDTKEESKAQSENLSMLKHDTSSSSSSSSSSSDKEDGSVSWWKIITYTVASMALVAGVSYTFLVVFSKRIHEWRYGNRQVLINEEEFHDESSDSHQFEMGRQDDINGEL